MQLVGRKLRISNQTDCTTENSFGSIAWAMDILICTYKQDRLRHDVLQYLGFLESCPKLRCLKGTLSAGGGGVAVYSGWLSDFSRH